MSDGMSEYWKGKRAAEAEKILESKYNDFFVVVEDKNKKGKTIYRLKFKLTDKLVPNGMTNKQEDVKKLGMRWLKKNEREADDMIFESVVLDEERATEGKETV